MSVLQNDDGRRLTQHDGHKSFEKPKAQSALDFTPFNFTYEKKKIGKCIFGFNFNFENP